MKSWKLVSLFVCLSVVGSLVMISAAFGQQKPIDLAYSNIWMTQNYHGVLVKEWATEIEKRTNGRVKITIHYGGTLTAGDKSYDGVLTGISDMANSVLAYTRGKFPLTEVADLPLGVKNGLTATKLINEYYGKFKPKEFDGVKVMYLYAAGPGILHTKKPVYKLEDLKGMKIRCTGLATKIVNALGGSPVAIPMPETYDALSRGVAEGSMAPFEAMEGWKLAEVCKYTTESWGASYSMSMFVVMNKDKWNSLPDDIKKIFTDVSQEWIDKHGRVWDAYDKVAIDYFKTFPGREIIDLPPAEMQKWVDIAVKPLIDDYIKQKTEAKLPAVDYQKYLAERVAYWSPKAPSSADSVAWVEKNVLPLVPTPSPTSK